jgi:hypothetical protein
MVTEQDEQLAAMPRFNCHVSQRSTKLDSLRKPATKVANASAVGAVIVTTPDSSSRYLLGAEYPFYVHGTILDALFSTKKRFGSAAWDEAREIMRGVKERTSLEAVCKLYEVMK